jgi:hypothetical protein
LIKEFRCEVEKIEINQENNLLMNNKLSEKITQRDKELYDKQTEIEILKLQLEKFSDNFSNNKDIASTDNKSVEVENICENEKEKYEDNIYHTFSINDECFKSTDVKLFICTNDDFIKNSEKDNEARLEMEEISESDKNRGDIKQINFSTCNSKKKISTQINYSHNQINNIYNNNYTNYNFNQQPKLQSIQSKVNQVENSNKNNSPISVDKSNKQIHNLTRKIGINYKDILPRYYKMYNEKDTTNKKINNSINYKSKEKLRDSSSYKSVGKKLNKSKEMRQESNKSIDNIMNTSDSMLKTLEISSNFIFTLN